MSILEEDLQKPGHLNEPTHIVRVHSVFDSPLSQLVPFVSGAAIYGETQL